MIKLQDIKSTTVEILGSIALVIALTVIVPNVAKASPSPADVKELMLKSVEAGECMSATTMLMSFGGAGEEGREIFTRFILPYWEAYAREAGAPDFATYLTNCEQLVGGFADALETLSDVKYSI